MFVTSRVTLRPSSLVRVSTSRGTAVSPARTALASLDLLRNELPVATVERFEFAAIGGYDCLREQLQITA